MHKAVLDVSERYRGQLFFWSDDPDFRSTSGVGMDVTPELVVVNQDLAASLCERVSRTHDLSLTDAAARRLRELTDESPVSTPSFRPPFELKGYQRRAFNVMREEPRVMLQLSPGTGKAQPVYAGVLTPGGFSRIGDLSVGDMVCASDGRFCPVTGTFDRGALEMWEVRLSDGSVVECCKDHLWKVEDHRNARTGEYAWKCMSTEDICASGVRWHDGRPRYKIPVMRAVDYGKRPRLPVDPYVLGVLIGDGCLTVGGVVVSTSEPDILDRVIDRLGEGYRYRKSPGANYSWVIFNEDGHNGLSEAIGRLGLRLRSYEKFIPEEYFYASADDRLWLLRGLFDTDGCVMANGSFTYSTTSARLRDDVVRLCRELGYVTWVGVDDRVGGIHKHVAYTVGIRTNDEIYASMKHAAREREHESRVTGRRRNNDVLSIVDVRRTGRFEEARCISVASPDSTYVTDGYVVTHNTTLSLAMACDRYDRGKCGRVVVVCPSALVSDWAYTVKSQTSLTVGSVKQSWDTRKRSAFWDDDSSNVWVLNYEKLRTGDRDHIEAALKGCGPLFILDEVQKVGSRKSAIHRNLAGIVKSTKAAGVIALTATPCTRGPENFYNEFRIIDYGVFGDVRSFERMFTEQDGKKDFWNANYIGFKNIPYMHVMAGAEVFSADKHRPEIAREFPKKDEQLIRYELSFGDARAYREIEEYGKSLKREERCGALFYLTGRVLCNMPEALKTEHDYEAMFKRAEGKRNEGYARRYVEQLREVDGIVGRNKASLEGSRNCAKLELATEKVGELLDAGEKVVVFAQHTHNCLIPLSEHWRSWRPLLYTGEQGEAEREEVKRAFKHGGRNLLLMSDAGQVGLNLQECRYLLHYDTPTSNAAYEQRSDRCVFAGAAVYTPNGLVRIEDVEVGMEVLDAEGGVTRVTDTWTSESDGRAVRLQAWGSGESADVTPDHRVLLKSGWVEAKDIPRMSETSWDYSGRCAQGMGHASIKTPDFKRFAGHNVSPAGVAYTHPHMVDMGDSLLLDEDMGFVFGYYLGDGFIRNGRCVAFAWNPSSERKAAAIDKICSKLSSIGFRPNRYRRSKTEGEVYCYGAQLAALFMDNFGTGSRSKRIPRFMWSSRDSEFLRGVYDGMMASDGYRRRGGNYDEYASVSETIHVFFWWLGRMLGMRTGISKYRPVAQDRTSTAYDDRVKGHKVGRTGKLKVVERVVREDRTVYDMTTESGSFVVAGIPVHNCHRVSSEFDSVTVMRMMAVGTVEERVEEAMQDRLRMAGDMGFAGSMSDVPDSDADRLMFGD